MKRHAKTALGIEVSQTHISFALVRQEGKRLTVLKAARTAIPQGTVENGRIKDAAAITKILGDFNKRYKIGRFHGAVIGLYGMPALVQILDMPKNIPSNVRQFVNEEVRQYVTVTSGAMTCDYCAVGRSGQQMNRLLAVAVANDNVIPLVRACQKARINVEIVELPLMGYMRCLYDKRIARKFDTLVLFALLRDDQLELCVLRSGTIDFVRIRDIHQEKGQEGTLAQRLAEEIEAIVRYYDIEILHEPGTWDVNIITDGTVIGEDNVAGHLCGIGPHINVQEFTGKTIFASLSLESQDTVPNHEISAVAVGLAMRGLGVNDSLPGINLLPEQITQIKTFQKEGLWAGYAAVVLLGAMLIGAGGLSWIADHARRHLLNPVKETEKTVTLIAEKAEIENKIKVLTSGRDSIRAALATELAFNWADILTDIRDMVPENLCIQRLYNKNGSPIVYIDGISLTYGAVTLFTNKLNESKQITSAELVKAEQNSNGGNVFLSYQIRCMTPAGENMKKARTEKTEEGEEGLIEDEDASAI